MLISKPVKEDGYIERIVYPYDLETDEPVLRAREVLTSSGKYVSRIRDFKTGHMIASNETECDLDTARANTNILINKYLGQ